MWTGEVFFKLAVFPSINAKAFLQSCVQNKYLQNAVNGEYVFPLLLIYHAKCADRLLLRYRVFCTENPPSLHSSVAPSILGEIKGMKGGGGAPGPSKHSWINDWPPKHSPFPLDVLVCHVCMLPTAKCCCLAAVGPCVVPLSCIWGRMYSPEDNSTGTPQESAVVTRWSRASRG